MVESWYRPDEVALVKETVPEKLESPFAGVPKGK